MPLSTLNPEPVGDPIQQAFNKIADLERRLLRQEMAKGVGLQVLTFTLINSLQVFSYNGGKLVGVCLGGNTAPSGGGVITIPVSFSIGGYNSPGNYFLNTGTGASGATGDVNNWAIPAVAQIYQSTPLPATVGMQLITGSASFMNLTCLMIEYPI